MGTLRSGHAVAGPHAGDDLLTIAEVADIVCVPIATVRYWRHLGTGRTASGRRALPAGVR